MHAQPGSITIFINGVVKQEKREEKSRSLVCLFNGFTSRKEEIVQYKPSVMESKYLSSKMIGRELTSPSRSAHSTGSGGSDRK